MKVIRVETVRVLEEQDKKKIRIAFIQKGKRIADFATYLGVSNVYINMVLNGKKNFTDKIEQGLIDFLNEGED